jgi:hypothetical protein
MIRFIRSSALSILFATVLPQAPADLFVYASAMAADPSIPSWIAAACCGPKDVHKLRPDQVHDLGDRYEIDGYPESIPKTYSGAMNNEIKNSQDGDYWAFFKIGGEKECSHEPGGACWTARPQMYCLFIPMAI